MPDGYSQPLFRTQHVHCPVISGYVTARLRSQDLPEISVSGFTDNTALIEIKNTGANTASLRLVGSDSYVSGPYEWVGTTYTLVPSGRQTQSVTPRLNFLELQGTSGTTSVHMQITSRMTWEVLGFAKDDARYPQGLNTARDPLTIAGATTGLGTTVIAGT